MEFLKPLALDSMWVLLSLLLIKFRIAFVELVSALIPKLFRFFSVMFMVELFG